MAFEPVRVEGLRELSAALRRLDAARPRMLRLALNDAMGVVITFGRQEMPRRSGRAVSTIRGASTRTTARVSEGGSKAPYVPWLDFGGHVGRRKKTVRPFQTSGRYLYPALVLRGAEIQAAVEGALTAVIRESGLEVT